MSNLNTLWAQLAVNILVAHGIRYFCISPGSRSTPLTLAATAHKQTQCIVLHDERGAAFHALGYARATGKPAALICTSGTAAANYYPAVIEAFQDLLPLLVLSADRPPELRDCGANQTIDQQHLFGRYTREFLEMPVPAERYAPRFVASQIEKALFHLRAPLQGPVHINFPFAEPLTPKPSAPMKDITHYTQSIKTLKLPHTHYRATQSQCTDALKKLLKTQTQGLLLLGRLGPEVDLDPIIKLAEHLQWPVFADPLSHLRTRLPAHLSIYHYDLLLRQSTFQHFFLNQCFKTILHIGRGFVSKALLQHLEHYLDLHKDCEYIQVTQTHRPQDPNHRVSQHWVQAPHHFAQQLTKELTEQPTQQPPQSLNKKFKAFEKQAEVHLNETVVNSSTLNELSAVQTCLSTLDLHLFVGNSMAIRDVDLLLAKQPIHILGSRGTSGIDGNVSMLAGIIQGHNAPCAMLCGDLTLYHDLNALGTLNTLEHGAIIVVINNAGGGIFSFLPVSHPKGGVQDPERVDRYFGTPHNWQFEHAAPLFGLIYHCPESVQALKQALTQASQAAVQGRSTLIEIKSQRQQNYLDHQRVYKMNLQDLSNAPS